MQYRDEITLLQGETIQSIAQIREEDYNEDGCNINVDEDNLVGQLLLKHELQQHNFAQWVHWSGMGLLTELVLFWFIVMVMSRASHG